MLRKVNRLPKPCTLLLAGPDPAPASITENGLAVDEGDDLWRALLARGEGFAPDREDQIIVHRVPVEEAAQVDACVALQLLEEWNCGAVPAVSSMKERDELQEAPLPIRPTAEELIELRHEEGRLDVVEILDQASSALVERPPIVEAAAAPAIHRFAGREVFGKQRSVEVGRQQAAILRPLEVFRETMLKLMADQSKA